MNFMTSPRGFILRFLQKARSGMFKDLDIMNRPGDAILYGRYCSEPGKHSLPHLRFYLDHVGLVRAEDFDVALKELTDAGLVSNGELTDEGCEAWFMENKVYLESEIERTPDRRIKDDLERAKVECTSVREKLLAKK